MSLLGRICTPLVRHARPVVVGRRVFSTTQQPLYTVVDHVQAQGATAGNTEVDKFCVVQLPDRQFKVAPGDLIFANKIVGANVGETVAFDQVLMVGSKDRTIVGRPVVPGALMTAAVEEQTMDKKVLIFKHRRRKSSQTMRGFRRQVTILRVQDIVIPDVD